MATMKSATTRRNANLRRRAQPARPLIRSPRFPRCSCAHRAAGRGIVTEGQEIEEAEEVDEAEQSPLRDKQEWLCPPPSPPPRMSFGNVSMKGPQVPVCP